VPVFIGNFTAGGFIVRAMNAVIRRALRIGLPLLIAAFVYHGRSLVDFSGAAPHGAGLTRLNRDLTRRMGGETRSSSPYRTRLAYGSAIRETADAPSRATFGG